MTITSQRRYPVGAEIVAGGVSFRVWAPDCRSVSVVIDAGGEYPLQAEDAGYFAGLVPELQAGALYRLRLDGRGELLADPASRFQPKGPGGPSQVIDPHAYAWKDADWPGVAPYGQVIYELHVGTFTPERTWAAAAEKLHHLRDVGITLIEMMPVNDFFGEFGWGYDGVLPYAPTHLYGDPDQLRAFVDTAHGMGLGVILDVVYNHFGDGDRFADFAEAYFTDRYENDWGRSINYDGPQCHGPRTFFSKNAAYWIDEFHFDGLRLDATQALFDKSGDHITALIERECRAAAKGRPIYLVAENEPQETNLVRPQDQGGSGLDALWNDDFHHMAMVALTGRREAYYHDYKGSPQEIISALKHGYLFQGQRYDWQDFLRGQPGLDLKPARYVNYLQNHDQIANSAKGLRMDRLAAPPRVRALTALQMLGPQTPLLFQGQEFCASSPFFFFADHNGELAEKERQGRVDFLSQIPSFRDEAIIRQMADPADVETLRRSTLDWSEFERHGEAVALHRDLLAMRRNDEAFARQGVTHRGVDGAVIGSDALLLRFFAGEPANDRLLLVNLGADLPVRSIADPLMAPPWGHAWTIVWSSENPLYGGAGQRPIDFDRRYVLSADSALVLAGKPIEPRQRPKKAVFDAWQERVPQELL